MADVNISMQDDSGSTNGEITPQAGGVLGIGFEPGKAQIQVDYSRQDSITVNVTGQVSLRNLGLPIDLGAGAAGDLSGIKNVNGTIAIEINKNVNANVNFGHDASGGSVTAGVTINFG